MRISLLVACSVVALALVPSALASPKVAAPQQLTILVKSDTEHGKRGPDGRWHDAFLPASFRVTAGRRVVLTVRNYDPAVHMIMQPKLGLMLTIPKGSAAHPATATVTFTPRTRGTFVWHCMAPCDPWAMTHVGFMEGRITVA